jgi:hypothetical protein|tara:strand:- start:419 stop:613 length:195 start_codon:yes stop_codon:yes gene_type:complete
MSDFKKIRLNPVDPYFTIEIDMFEDVEDIREQIEEKRKGPAKEEEVNPEEVDPKNEPPKSSEDA